ncbi:MAG: D-glycero-beta-D-manno-heptose 1-phosphate adenylyltransferase [Candidatus Omnitrophica bacterium]|nr:D-glycero-beta-D-manno-heptose 1-phosphate adenylyltransferase [Candidatus Omnitrophota bacterium]
MTTFGKVVKLPSLKKKLALLRRQGRVIAFTNGCFDILHYGHVSYLEAAKRKDRILIIGMNSDASVQGIKGPSRPIVPQDQRAAVLAGLACVDFVILFDEPTPYELIKSIQPDILIKGADWKGKEVAGSDVVKANGGRVEFIRYVERLSTTNIVEKIRHQCTEK